MQVLPSKALVTRLSTVFKPSNVSHVSIEDIIAEIRGDSLRELTSDARSSLPKDKDRYDRLKKKLPAALFSGVFSRAANAGFQSHSGALVLDFDDLSPSSLKQLKDRLAGDSHTMVVFTSPSGTGLKWVVATTAKDEKSHKAAWSMAAEYARSRFRFDADASGKDLSRKCFLCHDPEVFGGRPSGAFAPAILEPGLSPVVPSCNPETQRLRQAAISPFFSSPLLDYLRTKGGKDRVAQIAAHGPGMNHTATFNLCRLCRDLEREHNRASYELSLDEQREVFEIWHAATDSKFLRHKKGEYWTEFLASYRSAKLPISESSLCDAWRVSASGPIPSEAWAAFPDEVSVIHRRLVTLASMLAAKNGGKVFLPLKQIAELAGSDGVQSLSQKTQVSRVIKAMEAVGILRFLRDHNRAARKAKEWRYMPHQAAEGNRDTDNPDVPLG